MGIRTGAVLCFACLLAAAQDDISVVVSRDVFDKQFRGQSFDTWGDFVEAAGEQNNPGGEARLKAGFAMLFAALATVTVGLVSTFVLKNEVCAPFHYWLVFLILMGYAAAVFAFCIRYFDDPAYRVVTNLLFGLVPWNVSVACYLLVFLLFDCVRGTGGRPEGADTTGQGPRSAAQEAEDPATSSFLLRFLGMLAVLPSLGICLFLTKSYATGFTGVGTFFDVLALCLFVDVWRLLMHMALLVAPEWLLTGKVRRADGAERLPTASLSPAQAEPEWPARIPGGIKLTFYLCLCWFVALLLMKRYTEVGVSDPIKIHVLACLAAYVYFPVALIMAWHLNAIVLWLEPPGGLHRTVSFLIQVWVITATMLLVATLFNASEPNSIGIAGMAACIIFAASYFSGGSILNFIWMMAVSSTVSLGLVWCSVHFAGQIKALVD